MDALPAGTVTLLFTDIEGSTRLWEEHPEAMRSLLARHDRVLHEAIAQYDGHVFKTVGDAFCAVFNDAPSACHAALRAQQGVLGLSPPDSTPALRVRMALHAGSPLSRDGDYFGPEVNRVARILSSAHGGQVLLSASVASLLQERMPDGVGLVLHGAHRLKDLTEPEVLYQLSHPDLPAAFPPLRSLSSHPNNLPAQVTTFIGRERELTDVGALLDRGARLITLTGEGGIGKTRIALQIAADRIEQYPGGVWWVDLSLVRDAQHVMSSIAAALGIPEEAGYTALTQVEDRLRETSALLLIDNFEQVLDAADDVADLLRACPQATLLVTSRAVLNLSIEHEYAVPEMTLEESVALFTARAQQVRAQFVLDDAARKTLKSLCRRLDGIPLALELAAAQVRMLPVSRIEAQLNRRFQVLVSPFRDVSQRQRTLRAAIDWSYDLLNGEERTLYARLSVFVGGFTLEAAEVVCEGSEVFSGLMRLREQSLLRSEDRDDAPRFHMLESLRDYGLERLLENGDHDSLTERHARYFAGMARHESEGLQGADRKKVLARLSAEDDNLRQAREWLLERGQWDLAAQMTAALGPYWGGRSRFREGRHAFARCMRHEADISDVNLYARLLHLAGWFAYRQSDYGEAWDHLERSLSLYIGLGDEAGEAEIRNDMALTAQAHGDTAQARRLFTQALDISRRLGEAVKQASRLSNLGLLELQEGRYEAARQSLEEARSILERHHDIMGTAACLCNLSDLALKRHDWTEAETLAGEGLRLFEELEDRSGIALTLANMAEAASRRGDNEASESRLRQALNICLDTGEHWPIPSLLETLARVQAARGTARAAYIALIGARVLRARLNLPAFDQDGIETRALEADLQDKTGEAAAAVIQEQVASLGPEEIADRAMNMKAD